MTLIARNFCPCSGMIYCQLKHLRVTEVYDPDRHQVRAFPAMSSSILDRILGSVILLTLAVASECCVYVTVSSLPPDKLEVSWDCDESIRSVSIYGQDPRQHPHAKPLIQFPVADHPDRYYKTNITFNPEPFPGGWSRRENGTRVPESHCLYWTAAYFEGRPVLRDCFKIQPAWMAQHRREFKNLSLPLMFIPGTHNSGTDAMKTVKKRSVSHLDNFVLTQDQSVWNQLVYGIRFLDFRVGYYPHGNDPNLRYWINHDLLRVQPLVPVLRDVVQFIKSSPDEVVILDFHRFPAGFRTKNGPAIHRELIKIIEKELKDLIVPRPVSQSRLKMEDIWNTDKRIVVSYSEENFVWETPWLWTSVSQRWGNKQTPEALEKFLDNTFRDVAPRKLWAAMAELTPTPLDFLSNGSLRSMADKVNRQLSKWFTEKRNWTSRANIVAVDFFRGTRLIELAVQENLRRSREI